MSGRELDTDGTDSYHPEHPWEQAGHPLYVEPSKRMKSNWPPERVYPAGPAEAVRWSSLPDRLPRLTGDWFRLYGPVSATTTASSVSSGDTTP